jgi:phosphoribosylanthranilate isomerase
MENHTDSGSIKPSPQVKICGLTRPDEAVKCAASGADAVGLVFFSKSPRYVTIDQAKAICSALPQHTSRVGVFVDDPYERIMETVRACNLNAVQLHGNEAPQLVNDLIDQGLTVIKALYMRSVPSVDLVDSYNASAYLVECAKGVLPGGNAAAWNWENAYRFGKRPPMILAGGLALENIASAVSSAQPDAVDVSSGVESAPGRKDIPKVKTFIHKVCGCKPDRELRRIF